MVVMVIYTRGLICTSGDGVVVVVTTEVTTQSTTLLADERPFRGQGYPIRGQGVSVNGIQPVQGRHTHFTQKWK